MIDKAIKFSFLVLCLSVSWYFISQSRPATVEASTIPVTRTVGEQQVIDVYKAANDAVVYVSTRSVAQNIFGPISQAGGGSGFILDAEKGLVLTNSHVIADAREAEVLLSTGDSFGVSIIGVDVDSDLALLRIIDPPSDLVALELGDSDTLEVGQRVLAIGNPFDLTRTLTSGIVSSLGRTIRAESGRLIEDVVQTDAAINPGNSGGPLLDISGRVVGINTAILSRSGQSAGIGLAVPAVTIKRVVPSLLQHGRVLRPKIGVILRDTRYGTAVLYVQPGSPADKAGLKGAVTLDRRGRERIVPNGADFIVGVDGKKSVTKNSFIDGLYKKEAGESVVLSLRRGIENPKFREVLVKPELK